MKVLIAVTCLLAVAKAGFLGHSVYVVDHPEHKYYGPQHIPVIGANGVPVDEPAVQHARAEHAAAHAEASIRNGDAHHIHHITPVVYTAEHSAYNGPQHIPVIGAHGVPVDEPAVQHARAEHAAHHIEVKARNADVAVAAHYVTPFVHYRKRRSVFGYAAPVAYAHYAGPQHIPIIGANGVPVDEPAVQHARAEHAAAHVEAVIRNGDAHHIDNHATPEFYTAEHSVYHGPQHIPVIGANGVPVDEPAVQHARAEHAAHHIEAKVRNGDAAHNVAPFVHFIKRRSVFGYAAPVAYAHYAGPQHIPVIGANGVPVDEPAVQHARAEHAAAHVEAVIRNGDAHHIDNHATPEFYTAEHSVYHGPQHIPVIGANGVPVDEPAVQHARAEHAAHHIEAKVRNGDAAHHVVPFVHYIKRRSIFGYAAPVAYAHYAGPQHIPVIGANGVPVDEPAVQHARAEHAVAHTEATIRNGNAHHVVDVHHVSPVIYTAEHSIYHGPQHIPVIGTNGVPVDEPAVQHARAEHAAHHVEATIRNGDAHHVTLAPVAYNAHHIVAHANGAVVPADTVEVAAAKAAHHAAHVAAKAHHHFVHAY